MNNMKKVGFLSHYLFLICPYQTSFLDGKKKLFKNWSIAIYSIVFVGNYIFLKKFIIIFINLLHLLYKSLFLPLSHICYENFSCNVKLNIRLHIFKNVHKLKFKNITNF
jgi:hypothetical protein